MPVGEGLVGERVVVVDIEGNGQKPPEIVELAVTSIEDGVVATPRSWLVRPQRPITPIVTRKVHGIRNDDVAHAPPFDTIRAEVQALLGDAWFVAHNAHVEHDILAPQLPNWAPRGVLDTLRLARAIWPGRSSYSLDALIEQEHLDLTAIAATSHRHRAGYDAYATALLMLRLIGSLGDVDHPLERLAELASFSPASARDAQPIVLPPQQESLESLWTSPADHLGP